MSDLSNYQRFSKAYGTFRPTNAAFEAALQRVESLEQDLEATKRLMSGYAKAEEECESKLALVEQENTRLRSALELYGGHAEDCKSRYQNWKEYGGQFGPCSCGFEAALKPPNAF